MTGDAPGTLTSWNALDIHRDQGATRMAVNLQVEVASAHLESLSEDPQYGTTTYWVVSSPYYNLVIFFLENMLKGKAGALESP